MGTEIDQLLSDIEEAGFDVTPLKGSTLRQKVAELEAEVSEGRKAMQELAGLKKAPVVQEAFKKFGVDFDSLRPAEKAAIEAFTFEGEAPEDEAISDFIKTFDLPTKEVEATEQEQTPIQQIADHANSHQGLIPQPDTTQERIKRAESERDVATSVALKTAAFRQ